MKAVFIAGVNATYPFLTKYVDDGIVPLSDIESIYDQINGSILLPFEVQQILLGGIIPMDDDDKQGYNYTGRIIYNHGAIYKNPTVNKEIKGLLK